MTAKEYWYGDPWLVRDYLKAEEYRRERENYMAWLQGMYFAHAIAATIGNAFIEKGAKPVEYPDKPYELAGESEEQKRDREERELMQAELYMRQFVDFGKNWGKQAPDDPPPSA